MAHWSDRFVGMRYVPDEFECGDFAVRVQREVFGREIRLPTGRLPGAMGRARKLAEHRDEFAQRIDEHAAVEGDGVLINTRGLDQHIGVLCEIGGERWVMHNLSVAENAARYCGQVVRHRLREMVARGYKIEGFYRWI
jgi:hypothetical protein